MRFLFAILTLVIMGVNSAPNIIEDPGFEMGLSAWDLLTTGDIKSEYGLVDSTYHTGNYSFGFASPRQIDVVSQRFNTVAGAYYNVSWWMLSSGTPADNTFGASIVSTSNNLSVSLFEVTNAEFESWVRISVSFVAVSSESMLQFACYNLPSATFIDDVGVFLYSTPQTATENDESDDSESNLIMEIVIPCSVVLLFAVMLAMCYFMPPPVIFKHRPQFVVDAPLQMITIV